MQPVKLLPESRSVWRLHSLPNSSGISPVRSLSDRSRVTRADRPPRTGGMFPSRSSSSSSSKVTRGGDCVEAYALPGGDCGRDSPIEGGRASERVLSLQ